MRSRGGARFTTGAGLSYIRGSNTGFAHPSRKESDEKRKKQDLRAAKLLARKSKKADPIPKAKHVAEILFVQGKTTARFAVSCHCGWTFATTSRADAIAERNRHTGQFVPRRKKGRGQRN